jgi:hypothetical protein
VFFEFRGVRENGLWVSLLSRKVRLMFRLKNIALLATLVCGLAYEVRCLAQDVDCLQYPIYEDDSSDPPNYLYVADEYPANNCNQFDGEVYIWVPGNQLPVNGTETCPTCQTRGVKAVGGRVAPTDHAFPHPLKSDFTFGTTYLKKSLPLQKIAGGVMFNPSAGIGTPKLTRWVEVQTQPAGNPKIYVELFNVILDYSAAGITDATMWPKKTQTRHIHVGFETPAPKALPIETYVPRQIGTRKYCGLIDVKDGNDTVTYRVVTTTPLFK